MLDPAIENPTPALTLVNLNSGAGRVTVVPPVVGPESGVGFADAPDTPNPRSRPKAAMDAPMLRDLNERTIAPCVVVINPFNDI